jgi:hypothetical protein
MTIAENFRVHYPTVKLHFRRDCTNDREKQQKSNGRIPSDGKSKSGLGCR